MLPCPMSKGFVFSFYFCLTIIGEGAKVEFIGSYTEVNQPMADGVNGQMH